MTHRVDKTHVQILSPVCNHVRTRQATFQVMIMDLPALLLEVIGLLCKLGLLLGNICPLSLHHLPGCCHALRLGLNLGHRKHAE